jgi:hypothetical protein
MEKVDNDKIDLRYIMRCNVIYQKICKFLSNKKLYLVRLTYKNTDHILRIIIKRTNKLPDFHPFLNLSNDKKIKFVKRGNVNNISVFSQDLHLLQNNVHYFEELKNIKSLYIDDDPALREVEELHIDEQFKRLTNIKDLILSNRYIDVSNILNIPNVSHLSITACYTLNNFSNITKLKMLKTLTLQYMELNADTMDVLGKCNTIINLQIYRCWPNPDSDKYNRIFDLPPNIESLRCESSSMDPFYFNTPPISIKIFVCTFDGSYKDVIDMTYDLKDNINLKELQCDYVRYKNLPGSIKKLHITYPKSYILNPNTIYDNMEDLTLCGRNHDYPDINRFINLKFLKIMGSPTINYTLTLTNIYIIYLTHYYESLNFMKNLPSLQHLYLDNCISTTDDIRYFDNVIYKMC